MVGQIIWICVFQVLPVKLSTNLLQWILSACWCPLSYSFSKTSLALEVLESVSTSICVTAIISFAVRCADQLHALKTTRARAKMWSFKGIVGITLIQSPIFAALATYGGFVRTIHVATFDFTIGVPAFMTCCEMFIISSVFIWSFSATPYLDHRDNLPRCRGVGGALLEVLDIRDILRGSWYMYKIVFTCGHTRKEYPEQDLEQEAAVEGLKDQK